MQSTENDDMTDVEWVAAFKLRWQEADEAGMAGGRVEYALRPLLAELAAERMKTDNAPHEEGCMLGFHYEDATVGVCDCWKAGL